MSTQKPIKDPKEELQAFMKLLSDKAEVSERTRLRLTVFIANNPELVNEKCDDKYGRSLLMRLMGANMDPTSKGMLMENLIRNGADVNDQNIFGETALHYAYSEQDPSLLKKFIDTANPNPFIVDTIGETALDKARKKHQAAAVEVLENYQKDYLNKADAKTKKEILELQEYQRQIHFIKSKSHVLGIGGVSPDNKTDYDTKIEVRDPASNTVRSIRTQGLTPHKSIMHLDSLLKEYMADLKKMDRKKLADELPIDKVELALGFFSEIESSFSRLIDQMMIKEPDEGSTEVLLQRIHSEDRDLVILNGGYYQHAYSVALIKNLLIVCNRGYGRRKDETL